MVFAFHKHRVYLEGRDDTTVHTDNLSIVYLKANKYEDMSGRLIRWFQFLSRFTFQMLFRKGVENTDADMLTRVFDDDLSKVREDPDANWIYATLHKHFSKRERERPWHELRFQGPRLTGRSYQAKGPKWEATSSAGNQARGDLESYREKTMIAVPPLKRTELDKFLPVLTQVKRWAIWIPTSVLHYPRFYPTNVQIVVIQGGRPYGGERGSRLRGTWVTQGLDLKRDVIFEKVRFKKTGFDTETKGPRHTQKAGLAFMKRRARLAATKDAQATANTIRMGHADIQATPATNQREARWARAPAYPDCTDCAGATWHPIRHVEKHLHPEAKARFKLRRCTHCHGITALRSRQCHSCSGRNRPWQILICHRHLAEIQQVWGGLYRGTLWETARKRREEVERLGDMTDYLNKHNKAQTTFSRIWGTDSSVSAPGASAKWEETAFGATRPRPYWGHRPQRKRSRAAATFSYEE